MLLKIYRKIKKHSKMLLVTGFFHGTVTKISWERGVGRGEGAGGGLGLGVIFFLKFELVLKVQD